MASSSAKVRLSITVDMVMLVLILANLVLIVVDWTFSSALVQRQLQLHVASIHRWYDQTIHQNFLFYDLIFVGIFVAEILVRWGLAIYRERYHRWFFYPFIHWYDVLGCIPITSFRSLRLLRIIAMIPKMQRLGLLDLRKTYVYRTYAKYRDIVLEEVSDRVTVRIIEGLQKELRGSRAVSQQIADDVLAPQREALVEAVTHRLQEATAVAYSAHEEDFHEYLNDVIGDAIDRNREISTVASIPGIGRPIASLLERAVSDIVFNVVDRLVTDVAALENDRVLAEVTSISADALLSPKYDQRFNRIARSIVLQSLDVIKRHVQVREWKAEYTPSSSAPSPAPLS